MTRDIHVMRYTEKCRQLREVFVPLCIESHEGYYLNLLRIITLLYHLYIENEIYEW